MYDFLWIAMCGGVIIAIPLAILGNFLLWKKMNFLGDSVSHSAILGVALAAIFNVSSIIAITVVCFVFSFMIVYIKKRTLIDAQSLMVVNTQISLCLGVFLIYIFKVNTSIANSFFLGNLLGIKLEDFIYIIFIAAIVLIYLIVYYKKLLIICIDENTARAEGIVIWYHDFLFSFLLSMVIAMAMKLIGIMIVPAILILPALIADKMFNSIKKTIIFSITIAMFGIILGIFLSIFINVPASILISLILVFLMLIKIIRYALQ